MRTLRTKSRELRHVGLARALSKQGVCSRSVATSWILAGRVRLDGRVVCNPEAPTTLHSRIEVDERLIAQAPRTYLMLHKPRGVGTTAADNRERATVYSCFDDTVLPWLAPVGRLDRASEGLLLFTNDTDWAAGLTDPASHVAKTYHVQVEGIPNAHVLMQLVAGVRAQDGETLKVSTASLLRHGERNAWLELSLTEGRNRQLRRMLDAVNYPVLRLVRIALGTLALGDLAKGAWRYLTRTEIETLGRASNQRSITTAVVPSATSASINSNKC
jgi:23S rRNA pseudouridine2605 synthase